ncbi:hypothetical protein HYH03_018290 [Edaphochlamys debaryana]|uniref:Transcription initiation factor TFIID subunit 8 n=1 Tax=Edaphochlamys debaryana TaxID=47281 RepID=A0A836BN95_9CHLO|nr:hypothetical protein HYH03_018290 [Edaphochlamys debaryana]|eukprot:KAG2482800.1 hypothetical protein HYH03_018290 [Edaphochlamys debaryana]
MAEEYSRQVARVVAGQMAELTGFQAAQESAIEVLAELLVQYIQEVCTAAHSYAETAHRTDFNLLDLSLALGDMGTSMDDLKKYLDNWLQDQGPGAYDQGFVHPLPSEYPVRAPGRSLPSWEERREEAPAHVPPWLPAFPDRHTYVRTPAFPGHEEDPTKQSETIRQTRRQAARTSLAFKQQLLAVPQHPEDVAVGSNPFLRIPTVELVGPTTGPAGRGPAGAGAGADANGGAGPSGNGPALGPGLGLSKEVTRPASTVFEPVLGPVGEEAPMQMDERRRDMDATVKWQVAADAPSGSAVLGLPAGYALDWATRVQKQGQAFAPRRITEDAFGARAGEEGPGARFTARSRASRHDTGDERKNAERILAAAAAAEAKGGHAGGDHAMDD